MYIVAYIFAAICGIACVVSFAQSDIISAISALVISLTWLMVATILNNQNKILAALGARQTSGSSSFAPRTPGMEYAKQFAVELINRHLTEKHPELPNGEIRVRKVEPYIQGGFCVTAQVYQKGVRMADYEAILRYNGAVDNVAAWSCKILGRD